MPNRIGAVIRAFVVLALAGTTSSTAARAQPSDTVTPLAQCRMQDLPRTAFADAATSASAPPAGEPPIGDIRVDAPTTSLRLYVAKTPLQRELGLMCVIRMEPHNGMIFVFEHTSTQEFWMKNTLIPLDMVFVRGDGIVTTVAADVPRSAVGTPDDAVARRRGTGRFVLELNAGEAARDGIRAGTRLRLPPLHAQ